MVQIVAGILALLAMVAYGWMAVRFANYPAPWSAPWHMGVLSRWSAAGNAALRATVLGGLALVFLLPWPYIQGTPSLARAHVRPVFVPASSSRGGSVDLTLALLALGIAALAGLTFLVAHFVQQEWGQARKSDSLATSVDAPTLRDLTDQALLELLAGKDARRAILACYALMERGLAQRGLPRSPEETALDYSRRLLVQAGAPQGPLRSLTALFHLAGFSGQAINETMRQSAISSLRAIRETAQ